MSKFRKGAGLSISFGLFMRSLAYTQNQKSQERKYENPEEDVQEDHEAMRRTLPPVRSLPQANQDG
jgi:hypothetical protein